MMLNYSLIWVIGPSMGKETRRWGADDVGKSGRLFLSSFAIGGKVEVAMISTCV